MATAPLTMPARFPAYLARKCPRSLFPGALALSFVAGLTGCPRGAPQGGMGGFPPAPVAVQKIALEDVPIRFEYVGQTAGVKEAEVRARVQGILERRTYIEGSRVAAGQTLFVIDPRTYAAQAEQADAALAQAQAQAGQARRNLERLKPLASGKAISQREVDDATSAEESAAAAVKQAQARLTEAKLNLGYTTVTAPVAGFASRAQKSEGSLVGPGADSLLTTVSQLDPMLVNFSISESERLRLDRMVAEGKVALPSVAPGNGPAKAPGAKSGATRSGPLTPGYKVTIRMADGTIFPRDGRLSFIDPRINAATGAYDTQASLPNPDAALRPGQFVRVLLDGAVRRATVVVPQRAVQDGPQGKFVYVTGKSQDGKDVALPRPVTVGDWVDFNGTQQWIIESGLKPDETIVIDGMAKLFPIPTGAPIMLGPPPGAAPAGAAPAAPAAAADGKGAPAADAKAAAPPTARTPPAPAAAPGAKGAAAPAPGN